MVGPVTIRERLHVLFDARETVRQRLAEARASDGDGSDDARPDASDSPVSRPVRAAAEWSWRFLVIAGAISVIGIVLLRLRLIVFPVLVALLLTALLSPLVKRLRALGMPRALAAFLVFVAGLLVVVGIFTMLITLLANQFGALSDNVNDGVDKVRSWLASGPLHLSETQINNFGDQINQWVSDNRGVLAGGALATATVAIQVLGAVLLTLFTTYFFLYDGERVWRWCARLFPRRSEPAVLEAGRRAWIVLVAYVRATLIIAATDGLGVGVLVAILGVPLAAPLGILVFFGAFVPIVGATVSGTVAVLVALVAKGVVAAGIVLIGVIAIQQLEGHVLQPLIMGRFVRLHPLAVVLAVAVGAIVAGIPGAVIAVPFAAALKTVTSYFASRYRVSVGDTPSPAEMPPGEDEPPLEPVGAEPGSSEPPAAPDDGSR